MKKYSAENIIALAAQKGSTSKTFSGAIKYCIRNFCWPKMVTPGTGLIYIDRMLGDMPGQHVAKAQNYSRTKENYLAAEKLRKSEPEAKRARDCAKFRKNFLRKLNAETAKLTHPQLTNVDQICVAVMERGPSEARLEKIAELKSIALGKIQTPAVIEKITAGILVKTFSNKTARKYGAEINMSGSDAGIIVTRRPSFREHCSGNTTWKNGRPVSYSRAVNNNYVRSFGVVLNAQNFEFIFVTTKINVILPTGCSWAQDDHGVKAVRGADDYHPTAEDLLAKNAGEKIAEILSANTETRKLAAAEGLAKNAEMQGVYVCAADSLTAGNCVAGTKSFAEKHNIDIEKHYSAIEILSQGNGDTGRVRLAIRAAISRTKKENSQGFAIIAEHKI